MMKVWTVPIAGAAAAIALAAAPVAGAATTDYVPGDAGWAGSTSSEGLCVPVLLCPVVENELGSGTGAPGTEAGYLSTSLSGLTGVGATSIGIWHSDRFTYRGVDGRPATSVRVLLSRRADVRELLSVAGNSATYSVDVVGVSSGARSSEVIAGEPLSGADTWVAVKDAGLRPEALELGESYRLRITTRYETGVAVVPGGSADYDGVVLRARRETGDGRGEGGGADTLEGLVKSGAVAAEAAGAKGKRLRVRVRCSRKLEGACKVRLHGLVTKKGPKLTSERSVRVRSGQAKKVTLKPRKRFRGRVAGRRFLYVRQRVRADQESVTKVKRLKLR